MLPNITPVSVDETLILALTVWKPCGLKVCGTGVSSNLRSPRVENSKVRF